MTPYRLLLSCVGLSQVEAAAFHAVSLDTVKSWCVGRNPAPNTSLQALKALYKRQHKAAEEGARIAQMTPKKGEIELGYAVDDMEAQALGWPCASAQHVALGIMIAQIYSPVRLVPRGSTVATAAAADAHGA